jgi:hypothetical protein
LCIVSNHLIKSDLISTFVGLGSERFLCWRG